MKDFINMKGWIVKIVVFKGGVGNQLFQYGLINYLKNKGYRVYYRDETYEHNGLEVSKYFDVTIKRLPFLINFIYKSIRRFFPQIFNRLSTIENEYDENKIRFDGYWQDKEYISTNCGISFKELLLNEQNKDILNKIETTQSVSIHVRRGDYLKFPEIYGGICTDEYYAKAISKIRRKISNPSFYIFSDDIEWCRENINLSGSEFIDWNKGSDSIYDMYLMSKCKANIIANSTFSYWGAVLSNNEIVIYPKKWFANQDARNIFPNNWLGI